MSDLTGRGVFYGSALTEAASCAGQDVYIVGGANSAGQAAVYLARGARSVTTRLFTAAEQAQHHCQVGNVGLALGFVRSWLDFQTEHVS